MSKKHSQFDVVVVGAGPAGYISAIRCAQLGFKTACVDNWGNKKGQNSLGGAHLNAGCVATIALLESSKIYHLMTHGINDHGIYAGNISLDIGKVIRRKDHIIETFAAKIADIFTHHNITYIHGKAKLLNDKHISVNSSEHPTSSILDAKNIILATGSSPIELPYAPIDGEFIIDTAMALNLETVPETLAIIGGGVIGLELGGIWNRFGAKTILLEAQENFLYLPDHQIASEAYRIFKNQGLDMRLGARVITAKAHDNKVTLCYQDQHGTHTLSVDKLIVASGRKPNTDNLAAPEANLLLDENDFIHVDENCRTNLPGVYAVGDSTVLGPMLAHKGIAEGIFVAEQIAGIHNPINYDALPSVIYTDPEIAWVGQTEQALRAIAEPIKVGVFPLNANLRVHATEPQNEGIIKIIAHAETDAILGVHIIGAHASEILAEAVLAMEFSASTEDLVQTIHSHPTLSETLYEAALALKNRALHLPL
ncbi:dihydrolipoyl dehydrogenase [Crenothrix sp.]|uniref:dihydrolipoyl dehydrogenase n=1 Tax=Crenothrix sp. TaxID=3100433 RepID=UPI00374CDA13